MIRFVKALSVLSIDPYRLHGHCSSSQVVMNLAVKTIGLKPSSGYLAPTF